MRWASWPICRERIAARVSIHSGVRSRINQQGAQGNSVQRVMIEILSIHQRMGRAAAAIAVEILDVSSSEFHNVQQVRFCKLLNLQMCQRGARISPPPFRSDIDSLEIVLPSDVPPHSRPARRPAQHAHVLTARVRVRVSLVRELSGKRLDLAQSFALSRVKSPIR